MADKSPVSVGSALLSAFGNTGKNPYEIEQQRLSLAQQQATGEAMSALGQRQFPGTEKVPGYEGQSSLAKFLIQKQIQEEKKSEIERDVKLFTGATKTFGDLVKAGASNATLAEYFNAAGSIWKKYESEKSAQLPTVTERSFEGKGGSILKNMVKDIDSIMAQTSYPLQQRTDESRRRAIQGIGDYEREVGETISPAMAKQIPKLYEQPEEQTLSETKAALLKKVESGMPLTEGEQAAFSAAFPSFNATFGPEGRLQSMSFGGKMGEPTPTFKTQVQKETFDSVSQLQELQALKEKITPESFGVTSSVAKGFQEFFEAISPGSTMKGDGLAKWAGDISKDRDKLFRQAEADFALWVKKLTGVQFGEKEATRLKKGYPNSEDNYAEFHNKLDDIIDSYYRSLARLARFGLNVKNPTRVNPFMMEAISNSVPLGSITDDEIEFIKGTFSKDGKFTFTPNNAVENAGQKKELPPGIPDGSVLTDDTSQGRPVWKAPNGKLYVAD